MRSVKQRVRKLLRGLINDPMVIEYFADMVHYCIKKNIHELDVVLQKDMYPILADKYSKTEGSVEVELINGLKVAWREMDMELYLSRFRYNNKPTVKKILVLLIQEIKKQEEK